MKGVIMPYEVEAKYLVHGDRWRSSKPGLRIEQGYLTEEKILRTVRVRIQDNAAFLAVKGPSSGARRLEWEYAIPVKDAQEMLRAIAVPTPVEKTRHIRVVDDVEWFIDEYTGANEGLVVAEANAETESVDRNWRPRTLPEWAGDDVTNVSRYFNNQLGETPYKMWPDQHRTKLDGTVSEAIKDVRD